VSNARSSRLAQVLAVTAIWFGASAANDGSSRAFTLHVRSANSARTAFRAALRSLHMLSAVHLVSAFATRRDTFVEGFFTARYRGKPVAGALTSAKNGTAIGAFDLRERAGRTVPAMLAQQVPSSSRSRGSAVLPLHTVSFGTGTVAIPDSWRIQNSYQGCVEGTSSTSSGTVVGYFAFGCPATGYTPPTLPGANPRTTLVIPYGDVLSMFRASAEYPHPAGLQLQAVRIAESKTVAPPSGSGQAAYVLFDALSEGAPYRGLALVNVWQSGPGLFTEYQSLFILPLLNSGWVTVYSPRAHVGRF